jgi:hypothetical protein
MIEQINQNEFELNEFLNHECENIELLSGIIKQAVDEKTDIESLKSTLEGIFSNAKFSPTSNPKGGFYMDKKFSNCSISFKADAYEEVSGNGYRTRERIDISLRLDSKYYV